MNTDNGWRLHPGKSTNMLNLIYVNGKVLKSNKLKRNGFGLTVSSRVTLTMLSQ